MLSSIDSTGPTNPLQPIYSTFFKRNSVFVSSVFIGAFTFSIGFDLATTAFWDYHNKGVSREFLCRPR
jgi:hypothetical protein